MSDAARTSTTETNSPGPNGRRNCYADSRAASAPTIRWIGKNIIEEVESVGRSQLDAVESLITQALRYDLQAKAWPLAQDVPHWRAEARPFRQMARRGFTESMRPKLDLARLYADALTSLPDDMDGQPPPPLPWTCPVTLDELFGEP